MRFIMLLFILPIPWAIYVWNGVPDPRDAVYQRMEQELVVYKRMEQELVVRFDQMHAALSQNAKAIDTLNQVQRSYTHLRQLDSNFQNSPAQTSREKTVRPKTRAQIPEVCAKEYTREKTQALIVEICAKEYSQEVEKFLIGWVKATDPETAKAAHAVGDLVQEMVVKTGTQFDIAWPVLCKKLSPVDSGYPFWEASAIVDWAEAAMQGSTDNKERHEKLLAASRKHFWDLYKK